MNVIVILKKIISGISQTISVIAGTYQGLFQLALKYDRVGIVYGLVGRNNEFQGTLPKVLL